MSNKTHVFVAWDHQQDEVRDMLEWLVNELERAWQVDALGLPGDHHSGETWEVVRPRIDNSHALLAVMDAANANVAFELGYALAQPGKRAFLLTLDDEPPEWMAAAPLHANLVRGGARRDALWLEVLDRVDVDGAWQTSLSRPEPGPATAFLCPQGVWRRHLDGRTDWEDPFPTRDGAALSGLHDALRGIGRLIWILPRPPGNEARDGTDNARLAVIAGYAYGSGCKLHLVRQKADRKVLDAFHLPTTTFEDRQSFLDAVDGLVAVRRIPADLATTWRQRTAAAHRHLIPFLPTLEEQDLTRITIPLDLEHLGHAKHGPLPTYLTDAGEDAHTLHDLLRAAHAHGDAPRWAIRADPGAGKTTSARYAARKLAEDPSAPLPVYVPLATWAAHPTLPDLLDFASEQLGVPDALPTLQAAREEGRLVLLLDGLDEVPPRQRRAAHGHLAALATSATWARTPVVLLGREVAFQRTDLGEHYTPFTLSALDDDQQRALFDRLVPEEDADALWEAVVSQRGLTPLRPNPLLLTLIAVVARDRARAGEDLPAHRSEVYDQAIHVLLTRGHCDPPVPVRAPVTARDVLAPLALQLHGREGESWAPKMLGEVLQREVLRKRPDLNTELQGAWTDRGVEGFLEEVRGNAGLLRPVGGEAGPWAFMHRSIREYLAAEALCTGWLPEGVDGGLDAWLRDLNERQQQHDMRRSERREHSPDEAPPDDTESPFDRWGEVIALVAARQEDRGEHLIRLATAASVDLGLRAVRDADRLDPPKRLALLVDNPRVEERDTPRVLADLPLDDPALLHAAVPHTRTAHGLGLLWHLLTLVDAPPERRAFFTAAGRELPEDRGARWVAVEGGRAMLWPDDDEGVAAQPSRQWAALGVEEPFLMGSPEGVGYGNEHRQHSVTLTQPYALGRTTVTRAAYARFDPDHGCHGGDDHPVTRVSWYAARAYAAWLADGGALPTEAEWEHACRAGTTTAYSFGDDAKDLPDHGWFRDNSDGEAHPVAQRQPNPWGLYDLHGNVWEWCRDGLRTYESTPVTDPEGPPDGDRVLRGGAWVGAGGCRSAYRRDDEPRRSFVDRGFRVRLPAPAREPRASSS